MECLMVYIDAIRPNKIYSIDTFMHHCHDAPFFQNGVVEFIYESDIN